MNFAHKVKTDCQLKLKKYNLGQKEAKYYQPFGVIWPMFFDKQILKMGEAKVKFCVYNKDKKVNNSTHL